MPSVNDEWTLWIMASTIQHFKAVAVTNSISFFTDGMDKPVADLSEYVELRIQGPYIKQASIDVFVIELDVSMLISVKKGGDNIYRPHEIAGWFQAAALHICVYDKGAVKEGDYVHQFDLLPQNGSQGKVEWHYLGQPDLDVGLLQGVLVAKYDVTLT